MKRILSILLLTTFLTGCDKPVPMYRATLFNPTSHNIKILFYKSGVVSAKDTIFLDSNAQFLFAYGPLGRGSSSGIGRGFNSDYFGGSNDSIVVVFDSIYSITHYANTPSRLASHYYLNNSNRNLGNPYSYEYEVIEEDEDELINDHKYYFTEQDYLDAKD